MRQRDANDDVDEDDDDDDRIVDWNNCIDNYFRLVY